MKKAYAVYRIHGWSKENDNSTETTLVPCGWSTREDNAPHIVATPEISFTLPDELTPNKNNDVCYLVTIEEVKVPLAADGRAQHVSDYQQTLIRERRKLDEQG